VPALRETPLSRSIEPVIVQGFPRLKLLIAQAGCNMPKMKTHKGTKKRFRLTATGKVKHRSSGTSHLAARRSKKRRRNLRGTKVLDKAMVHQITTALGKYSS
jgi:large subunit ribosomal protein L35